MDVAGAAVSPAAVPKVFTACTNCRKDVPTLNYALHESVCSRRFFFCAACDVLLPTAERATHMTEFALSAEAIAKAIKAGQTSAVIKAIDHGVAINMPSMLDAAASGDAVLVLRILRCSNFAVDATEPMTGYTLLHRAAASGSSKVVELLLEHGANVHATSALGKTPLDVARGDGVKLALVARGASLGRRPSSVLIQPSQQVSSRSPLRADAAPQHEPQLLPQWQMPPPRRGFSRLSLVESIRETVRHAQQHGSMQQLSSAVEVENRLQL